MRTLVITEPASEPILLDEFKDHLRLDGSDEDASLGAFIQTARSLVENYLSLALVDRTLALYLDRWPLQDGSGTLGAEALWWSGTATGALSLLDRLASVASLAMRPVSAISSIVVVAPDGTETLWAADNYQLKPGLRPLIALQSGRRWPVPGRTVDGIKITLTAGFGPSWNQVPASLRHGVLVIASHLYANRGEASMNGDTAGVIAASGAASMLAPYHERRL
jgi:Phage gp6-like head-tail connector protein